MSPRPRTSRMMFGKSSCSCVDNQFSLQWATNYINKRSGLKTQSVEYHLSFSFGPEAQKLFEVSGRSSSRNRDGNHQLL